MLMMFFKPTDKELFSDNWRMAPNAMRDGWSRQWDLHDGYYREKFVGSEEWNYFVLDDFDKDDEGKIIIDANKYSTVIEPKVETVRNVNGSMESMICKNCGKCKDDHKGSEYWCNREQRLTDPRKFEYTEYREKHHAGYRKVYYPRWQNIDSITFLNTQDGDKFIPNL